MEKIKLKTKVKENLKNIEIKSYDPEKLFYPLTDLRCNEFKSYVKEGDKVKVGDVIGKKSSGWFEVPIHATVSGTVLKEERVTDQYGKKVKAIVISNDHKYQEIKTTIRTEENIEKLSKEEIVDIVNKAGIVGLGGASFPASVKINVGDKKIDYVVANACECEPYVISDYNLLKHNPDKVILGVKYVMQATNAKTGIILVNHTYKDIIDNINRQLDNNYNDLNIKVKSAKGYYGEGWELITIKQATKIKVPIGKLTSDYGVVNLNSSTLAAISDAVRFNKPLTKRYFTISGTGIENRSYLIPIGTSIKELIENENIEFKDYKLTKSVIVGGPMMGTSLRDYDFVTSDTTTSIIIDNIITYKEDPCIRCMKCINHCPAIIEPYAINIAVKNRDIEKLKELDVNKCVECGSCSYICPSKIELTQQMIKGKKLLQRNQEK